MRPVNPVHERFLLFSQPRCGSTILMRVLNCHPSIRCADEPFNTDTTTLPDLEPVRSVGELSAALDRVWSEYSGLKHVWHPAGWPFPQHSALNRHLLLHAGCRVIFFTRRNVLQQVVSNELALQTRFFHVRESDGRRRDSLHYRSLDQTRIRQCLANWPRRSAQLLGELKEAGVEYLELRYEDLYGPDEDRRGRRQAVLPVLDFLGRDFEGADVEKIDRLLDPRESKVNSERSYRRVPGIQRIEEKFGSDDTGWLFR